MTSLMQPMEGMRIRFRDVDPNDRLWVQHSACRGLDPALFHPDPNGGQYFLQVEDAKAVCFNECKVREECGEYALKYQEKTGVWGGMSERDRRTETRRRQRAERKKKGSRG